jgi:hypothetical protein
LIGSPEDYEKNRANNSFPQNIDLSIPIDETDQGKKGGQNFEQNESQDSNLDLDQINLNSPINGFNGN